MDSFRLVFVECDKRTACQKCAFRLDDTDETDADCMFDLQIQNEPRIQCQAKTERFPQGREDGRSGYWKYEFIQGANDA